MLRSKYIAVPTFAVTHVHENLSVLDRFSRDVTGEFLYYNNDKVLLESQFTTNLAQVKIDYNNLFSRVNTLDSRYYKVQNQVDALTLRTELLESTVKPEVLELFNVVVHVDGTKTLLWDNHDIFEKSETSSRPYQIQTYTLSKAFQYGLKKYMIEDGSGSTTPHNLVNVTFTNNAFVFNAKDNNAVLTSKRFYLLGGLDGNEPPKKYFVGIYPYNQYYTLELSFNGGVSWSPYVNETLIDAPTVATGNASIMLRITINKALFNAAGIRHLYGFYILHD